MTRPEINRKIREILGLSGRELSILVEVTKQTISNYERGLGTSRPTERVIEWELDNLIEKCEDEDVKKVCYLLKTERTRLAQ